MAVIGTAAILIALLAGCSAKKNLEAGAVWEVAETTNLGKLTIAEGAVIKAPEGKSLTMTVDAVETVIRPGTYRGNIVLKVIK